MGSGNGEKAAGAIKSLSTVGGGEKQISCVFLLTCVLIETDFNDKLRKEGNLSKILTI